MFDDDLGGRGDLDRLGGNEVSFGNNCRELKQRLTFILPPKNRPGVLGFKVSESSLAHDAEDPANLFAPTFSPLVLSESLQSL